MTAGQVRLCQGRVLFAGCGEGRLLSLQGPLSFWGGIDPARGTIIDKRHADYARSVAGTVLALARPIGSSSSSSVLLELIHAGLAPAALLLGRCDAILIVGCLIAREMGMLAPPVMELDERTIAALPGGTLRVEDGTVYRVP